MESTDLPVRRRVGLQPLTELPHSAALHDYHSESALYDWLIAFRDGVGGWSDDLRTAHRLLHHLRNL
jgi:hypothetical protein